MRFPRRAQMAPAAFLNMIRSAFARPGRGFLAVLWCIALALVPSIAAASDGFAPNPNGMVSAVVQQPSDGKLVIGGAFTAFQPDTTDSTITLQYLARINLDGTLDTSFNPNPNGSIESILVLSDGSLIVAGQFTSFQPSGTGTVIARNHLARILPDGSIDPKFNAGIDGVQIASGSDLFLGTPDVFSMVQQTDGKIVVAGFFNRARGTGDTAWAVRSNIVRFNADGTLDSTFAISANQVVMAVAQQSDGSLLMGGGFTSLTDASGTAQARSRFARVLSSGLLDSTFTTAFDNRVNAITVNLDGRIFVGGEFLNVTPTSTSGATSVSYFAAINQDGSLDTDFLESFTGPVGVLALQPDGSVLVGGSFGSFVATVGSSAVSTSYIARIRANGVPDTDFSARPVFNVSAIQVLKDGNIVIGGMFRGLYMRVSGSYVSRHFLARLTSFGEIDTEFDGELANRIDRVYRQSDGSILAIGNITNVNGVTRDNLVRFLQDGSLDPAFSPTTDGTVYTLALQSDGKIVIGGSFTKVDGVARNNMARLNPDGTLDTAFDPNVTGTVNALALQSDGKILIGGSFTQLQPNGATTATTIANMARLNTDGTVDTAFQPGPSSTVMQITLDSTGLIYVSGAFSYFNGTSNSSTVSVAYMARLKSNGSVDKDFVPLLSSYVTRFVLESDTSIIVAGSFTGVQDNGSTTSYTRNHIARVNSKGVFDSTYDPNVNGSINDMALLADGSLIIAGNFSSLAPNGATTSTVMPYIVHLNKDGTVVTGYNPDPNGTISSLALQSDGRLLVAGLFSVWAPNGSTTLVRRRLLVRLNTDGTIDSSFVLGKLGTATSGYVRAFSYQPDGTLLVGGSFSGLLGSAGANVAKITPEATADSTFVPNPDGPVNAIAKVKTTFETRVLSNVIGWLNATGSLRTGLNLTSFPELKGSGTVFARQPDGKILLGGSFTTVSGTQVYDLLRFNQDGSLDASFAPVFNGAINAILVQSDGAIVVGGDFTTVNGNSIERMARLSSSGVVDTTFMPTPNSTVYAILPTSDGGYIVGGAFTSFTPNTATVAVSQSYLAKITKAGPLDTAAMPTTSGSVYALAQQSDGKILVGGSFATVIPKSGSSTTRYNIARLNTDYSVDTAFDPYANSVVSRITLQSDGKILVGGGFTTFTPNSATTSVTRHYFARLNSDGTVDSALADLNMDYNPDAIVIDGSGNMLLGGSFTSIAGVHRKHIARISSSGVVDPDFNPNANQSVSSIILADDGSIILTGSFSAVEPYGAYLLGGKFANVSGTSAPNLAFVNSDGDLVASYGVGTDGEVRAVVSLVNGDFLVGGAFAKINSVARGGFARLLPTGAVDTAFTTDTDGRVDAIAVQADGKILIGGTFTKVGGITRLHLARLNADGSVDTSYVPSVDDDVTAISVGADGRAYVAGSFKSLNGSGIAYVGRLNSDGSVDSTFNPSPDGPVAAVAVFTDGSLVIGGSFSQVTGTASPNVARLNADGSLVAGGAASLNGPVTALIVNYDGKAVVGGSFTQVDGKPRNLLTRLGTLAPAADVLTVSSDLSTIRWSRSGSAPVLSSVAFDVSTDYINWVRLGLPTYDTASHAWTLSGQSLPSGSLIYVRAESISSAGQLGSSSLLEAIRAFYPQPYAPANSVSNVVGTTGHAISFMLGDGATGTTYSATGLPTGVTIDRLTGLVSGTPTQAGTYTVVLAVDRNGVISTFTQTWLVSAPGSTVPSGNPGQKLLAVSSLSQLHGSNAVIFGFVINGTAPKSVLMRAVGPTLAAFNITNPVAKPLLRVYDASGNQILSNQGWNNDPKVTAASAAVGDFPLQAGSTDAALVATLQPGLYTMLVSDASGTGGAVIAEAYDADNSSAVPRLTSLSTRGYANGTSETITAGFIVGGNTAQRVLVRGVGVGLAQFGLTDALADARIKVYSVVNGVSQLVAVNDNWETQTALSSSQTLPDAGQLAAAFQQTGDFALTSGSTDAAMILTLNPGAYTLVVEGAKGTAGSALAEIYLLP